MVTVVQESVKELKKFHGKTLKCNKDLEDIAKWILKSSTLCNVNRMLLTRTGCKEEYEWLIFSDIRTVTNNS